MNKEDDGFVFKCVVGAGLGFCGALAGAILAGPPGAVVGGASAVLGVQMAKLIGASEEEKKQKNKHNRRAAAKPSVSAKPQTVAYRDSRYASIAMKQQEPQRPETRRDTSGGPELKP